MITREQIEEALSKTLVIDNKKGIPYAVKAIQALYEQEQQGSGMRWVKAKDRVPTEKGSYIIRYRNYEGYLTTGYAYEYYIEKHSNTHRELEWLDESTPSEPDRLREEHKLMYAKLQQIQALIEVKGSYNLLEPVQSLISKIETNGK